MSNLNVNRLNQVYTAADIAAVKTSAATINAKIPATAVLTEAERKDSSKDIDVENKVFVEDTINEFNLNGATILPARFLNNNMATDFTFFEQNDELETILKNLVIRISDAKRIAGREAFATALRIYEQYKDAAEEGVPGAQASYDKLKVRFEKLGKNTLQQPEP